MILKRFCGTEENKWTMLMENKANLLIKIDFQYVHQVLPPFFSPFQMIKQPETLMEGGKIKVPVNSCDALAEVEGTECP